MTADMKNFNKEDMKSKNSVGIPDSEAAGE